MSGRFLRLAGAAGAFAFWGGLASAGPVTINFDAVDTSRGSVTGAAVEKYLAGYGIAVVEQKSIGGKAALTIEPTTPSTGFSASSYPNVFHQTGANGPISFTIRFAHPLRRFSFTRAQLVAGPNGITHPGWSAEVLDAKGRVIGNPAGEDMIRSFVTVPARSFSFDATANDPISMLKVSADDKNFTAFSSVVLDDFQLTSSDAK